MTKLTLAQLVAFVLLPLTLGSSAMAQSTPKSGRESGSPPAEEPKKDETDRPRPPISLFGDPQRFTRMGGWGGMGGTMAQFGLTKAMLVSMPGVQKELKITDEQKEKLKEWSDTFRKRGEELARGAGMMPGGAGGPPGAGAGGPGGAGQPGPPGQGGAMPDAATIGAQIFKAMNFMSTLNSFFKEAEDAANKILTRSQRIRLNQIALQMEGLSALGREDIALQLNLDPQKFEMIQQILADARSGQMRYWVGQMTQMALTNRGNFRRPGSNGQGRESEADRDPTRRADFGRPPGTGQSNPADAEKAATKQSTDKAEPASEEEEAKQKAARDARRAEMRKRFETMQLGSDQIQNAAMTQILKLLSTKQKAAFDRMLGEPFDPNALIEPPKPPDADEANAKKAKSTGSAATPAQPKGSSLRERRFGKGAATAPPQ